MLPAVTVIIPLVAPVGTGTVITVGLQLQAVPVTPLNLIVPLVPRLLPLMITFTPTPPRLGEIPETLGVLGTLKIFVCKSDFPPTVTTTFPVVAPEGTVTWIDCVPHTGAVPAETPLNVTVLEP